MGNKITEKYFEVANFADNEQEVLDAIKTKTNLFWSYRPEFYDTTFHLWAGIKSLRDQSVGVEQIIEYTQNWLEEYKKLLVVMQDSDFERKFDMMMAERCVGALMVDIQNQHYDSDRSNFIVHLTELFRDLFKHFADKLEKTKIK